jgi:carboxyl-terminal processing protease
MKSVQVRTVVLYLLAGVLLGAVITWTLSGHWETLTAGAGTADPGRFASSQTPHGSGGDGMTAEQLLQSSGLSREQFMKITTTLKLIETKFYLEVDRDVVVDGAVKGMLEALNDPYTVYMNAEETKHFNSAVIESTFTGIGAEVTLEKGKVTVVAPIKGSPADRAGIRAKDVILSVNGESLEGLSLNEAVMKIRGPKGTQARLLISRESVSQPFEIIVVRDEIDFETVYSRMTDDGIGIIEVRQFAQNTADRFLEELSGLEKQGMKGLIIDLRNNPGGVLMSAITMAEPFVRKDGVIVQVEDRDGNREIEVSRAGGGKDYPVAVLVNKGSASASEILAAAIRESGGGTIVGETTFGKGLVQSTFDSGGGDGSNVKMTIARWLTPKGNDINGKGIVPDIQVELPYYYNVMPLSKSEDLAYNDLNNDVKNLQIMLKGLGYEPDREDGYFSEKTEEEVRRFQEEHGLPVTGVVDNETAEQIEQALIEKMMNPDNDTQLNRALRWVKSRLDM